MRLAFAALIVGSALAAASPASACRLSRTLTEAEFRERTVVFTAVVTGMTSTAIDEGGGRMRVDLAPNASIRGPLPLHAAMEADYGDVVTVFSCGSALRLRAEDFPVGAEVVVIAWRRGRSAVVFDAAVEGTAEAAALRADVPRPGARMPAQ